MVANKKLGFHSYLPYPYNNSLRQGLNHISTYPYFWTRCFKIVNKVIIIIIIIKTCRQHGYPWPSLATFPYRSSPPAGLLAYIPCPHIAAVCKFGLVVLLLLGHMWGSIVVRHLRARLCFSSSVRRVWLVRRAS